MLSGSRRAHAAVCVGVMVYALSPVANSAAARCAPPVYREGNVWENTKTAVEMTASIAAADFARPKLVCLAEALRKRYPGRKKIEVLIFSSAEAARSYHGDLDVGDDPIPSSAEPAGRHDAAWAARQLHAVYSYVAAPREEHVTIKPTGYSWDSPEDTRITLPVTLMPRCRLELTGRCLLALDDVLYDGQAYASKIAATITVTGIVTPRGLLTDMRVADAKSVPPGDADSLTRHTIDNLKSWRLEPASRQDTFRLTYSYAIDSSLRPGEVVVRFGLPNQVTIRANPQP